MNEWWRAEIRGEMRRDAIDFVVGRLVPLAVIALVITAAYGGSLPEAGLGILGGLLAAAWLLGPMIAGIYLVRTGRYRWGWLLLFLAALQIALLIVLS